MHVPTDWTDRIVIENGKITRIVQAEWTDSRHGGDVYYCDVYKENDDGEFFKQNIYNCLCTYGHGSKCVAFPGLPMYAHGPKDELAEEEGWCQISKPMNIGGGNITDRELDRIFSLYPDFRYTLKKYPMKRRYYLLEILIMWKKHPELELVLAAGFESIGMNENFWRLTEKKRKEICLFMRRYPEYKTFSLREVQSCIKSGKPGTYAAYLFHVSKWDRMGGPYSDPILLDDFIYLQKIKGIAKDCFETELDRKISIFKDVLSMLSRSSHDNNDPYWRHPKDLIATHNRLQEEEAQRREAERIASMTKELSAMKLLEKRFADISGNVSGYSIFITSDYNEWKKQADTLHQCIVAAGYYQSMARGGSFIVFIQKDGVPVATAQIHKGKKIGQFYADELDRNNCLPAPEIKEALNKWLDSIPASKFNPIRKRNTKKAEVAA